MRENEDEFGRFVPLLRRIIILVAVIIAVPVILWTITAFVRAYVGPPKLPTFHQLASSALSNVPTAADANTPAGDQALAAPGKTKISASSSPTSETQTTASDARDLSSPPKASSLLGDRVSAAEGSALATAPKMADISAAAPADAKPAEMPATAGRATPDAASANSLLAVQQTAALTEPQVDTTAAPAPLSGAIPLPRRRPRAFALADGSVPMPRRRPEVGATAAPPETPSAGPLDFLQNLFH